MANHVRQQLREAIATALTGLTTTGSRVFQSRTYALETTDLPAIRIGTLAESAQPLLIHASSYERLIEVSIEGVATELSDLDDKLDLIAKEIEIALSGGVSISTKLIQLQYQGTDIEFDSEAEKPRGQITLRYVASVWTSAAAPDVFL